MKEKILAICDRSEWFDTPLARAIREELNKTDEKWQRPDVRFLDAKQIIADLDSRKNRCITQREHKRTLMEDIEGL